MVYDAKYSVFIPHKDQCDICVSAMHSNIDKAKFQRHIMKDQAKAEKAADKTSANEWEEHEGDLSSEVCASNYSHFDNVIRQNQQLKEFIIWSDGCRYQNQNSTVANMCLELSRKRSVNITQMYLVAGHMQM